MIVDKNLTRCPAFCIKLIKVKENGKEIIKKIPDYLKKIESETPSDRLFCDTNGCDFMYRDEHGRDIWKEGTNLLLIPIQDPLDEVNI